MAKSVNIPDVLGVKKTGVKTLEAGFAPKGPQSPFSGQTMTEALCGDTPVYIDQSKRIVVPKRIDGR